MSRANNNPPTEVIDDDIPCHACAETAQDLRTERYTGTPDPEALDFQDVIEEQQTDDFCQATSASVAAGQNKWFFLDDNHALYRNTSYGNQLVIPKSQQQKLLALQHHATVAAHPGMNKMYYTIRTKFYWPSMISDIHGTITKCTTCAQNRLAVRRQTTPLTLFPAKEPLTDLSIDILGPLPPSTTGNRFILVVTDRFSKLTKCIALRVITAISVSSAVIEHWVACYGPPDKILSDQGPQFMSSFFITVMKVLGVETIRTTAYHPQTNGQVERYNRTLATQLRHYVAENPKRWDELLPVLTLAYNSQPHRSTGISPFALIIPRWVPNLSVRNLPPETSLRKATGTLSDGSPVARKREFMARLRTLIPAVVQALRKTQQRYKRNFDANLGPRNVKVKIGDYVYTTNHHRDNKLASKAIGPFMVVDADDSTFVIEIDGTERRVSSDHTTPAPRPAGSNDKLPHPLLDGFDKPRQDPKIHDEYVIEKLLAYRKKSDSYEFKVRWYDYYPKDDTWGPVENLPRSMVMRYLRSKKVELPGFTWKRTHVASQPTTVALADTTSPRSPAHWTPQI